MKRISLTAMVIAMVLILGGCRSDSPNKPARDSKKNKDIVAQTFKTSEGWGYAVFVNDKLFIKQSLIPVMEGNKGFEEEKDAIKVASMVVAKLRHHEKPTISLAELQQCGIVNKMR